MLLTLNRHVLSVPSDVERLRVVLVWHGGTKGIGKLDVMIMDRELTDTSVYQTAPVSQRDVGVAMWCEELYRQVLHASVQHAIAVSASKLTRCGISLFLRVLENIAGAF